MVLSRTAKIVIVVLIVVILCVGAGLLIYHFVGPIPTPPPPNPQYINYGDTVGLLNMQQNQLLSTCGLDSGCPANPPNYNVSVRNDGIQQNNQKWLIHSDIKTFGPVLYGDLIKLQNVQYGIDMLACGYTNDGCGINVIVGAQPNSPNSDKSWYIYAENLDKSKDGSPVNACDIVMLVNQTEQTAIAVCGYFDSSPTSNCGVNVSLRTAQPSPNIFQQWKINKTDW